MSALNADERDAWLALLAVVERLPAVLDSQLRRAADLSHFEYRVLAALAAAPGHRLRMTVLAERTDATLTRLSHVVRRLEHRRLVDRAPSADDGRVTIARLTAAGAEVVVLVEAGHVETVRRHVLDPLTPAQVQQLRRIGGALRDRLGAVGASASLDGDPSEGDTGGSRAERGPHGHDQDSRRRRPARNGHRLGRLRGG